MPRLHRFLREFVRARPGAVVREEVTYLRDDVVLPARIYLPAGFRRPLPAWAVLHGLTRTGRAHRGLDRLARSLAAAGNVVFVPDIPEWRELRVAPALTACTIRAAVRALAARPEALPGHLGLLAFSFGATQAIRAGADPAVASLLGGIVAWGGYADLQAAFRYALTGSYQWDGGRIAMEPDPYGLWVVCANYLPRIPGLEDHASLAAALHELAAEVGDRGRYAWEPVFDPSKVCLRERLPPQQRELFDYLAPPAHRPRRDEPRARELAGALAAAALRTEPELAPDQLLPRVRVPVLLGHGRDDRLIPYPESLRLARGLPRAYLKACVVTGLFAHSGGTLRGLGVFERARESVRFLRLLQRILDLV